MIRNEHVDELAIIGRVAGRATTEDEVVRAAESLVRSWRGLVANPPPPP